MKVSISKCVSLVGNRFKLCVIASHRAKGILASQNLTSNRNQKPAVLALQEVEKGVIDPELVYKNIIDGLSGARLGDKNVAHRKDESAIVSNISKEEIAETGGLDKVEIGIFDQENLDTVD